MTIRCSTASPCIYAPGSKVTTPRGPGIPVSGSTTESNTSTSPPLLVPVPVPSPACPPSLPSISFTCFDPSSSSFLAAMAAHTAHSSTSVCSCNSDSNFALMISRFVLTSSGTTVRNPPRLVPWGTWWISRMYMNQYAYQAGQQQHTAAQRTAREAVA